MKKFSFTAYLKKFSSKARIENREDEFYYSLSKSKENHVLSKSKEHV